MRTGVNYSDSVVVFDLDDTLYREEDYLLSAYRTICGEIAKRTGEQLYERLVDYRRQGLVALDELLGRHEVPYTIAELLEIYRYHAPAIAPRPGVRELLAELSARGAELALITDGRSRTQRAKLAALGLDDTFASVSVSGEIGATKPSPRAFRLTMERLPARRFAYVADNFDKDFIAPNALGWVTIGLEDDGHHIHKRPARMPPGGHPDASVTAIEQVTDVLDRLWTRSGSPVTRPPKARH